MKGAGNTICPVTPWARTQPHSSLLLHSPLVYKACLILTMPPEADILGSRPKPAGRGWGNCGSVLPCSVPVRSRRLPWGGLLGRGSGTPAGVPLHYPHLLQLTTIKKITLLTTVPAPSPDTRRGNPGKHGASSGRFPGSQASVGNWVWTALSAPQQATTHTWSPQIPSTMSPGEDPFLENEHGGL